MQDFDKIAAVQALISGEQTKEAFLGVLKPLATAALGLGKKVVKNPLKSLSAAGVASELSSAATRPTSGSAIGNRIALPRNNMATF